MSIPFSFEERLRKGEADEVVNVFGKELEVNLQFADEKNLFYEKLLWVTDPEKKRKTIGETFIRVFEREAKEIGDVNYLAQGTLYPDVIESVSFKGPSVTIKSHHNVGGLPEHMDLDVLEPLRELFKDEVRSVGKELGLSDQWKLYSSPSQRKLYFCIFPNKISHRTSL